MQNFNQGNILNKNIKWNKNILWKVPFLNYDIKEFFNNEQIFVLVEIVTDFCVCVFTNWLIYEN